MGDDDTTPFRTISRKQFLMALGVAGFSTAVAGVLTLRPETGSAVKASGEAASKYRWGMVIDLSKCIGCKYCVYACQAVNDVADDTRWNVYLLDQTETGNIFHMTRPCMHCADAPCVHVCPVGATYARGDGLVVMDYDRCIGCRYCIVACPYSARSFNWTQRVDVNKYEPEWGSAEVERRKRGVVEKCTFCVHRIDHGLDQGLTPGVDRAATPACVNICPAGARKFGNLNDPDSEVARMIASMPVFRLREELGTEPNVFYIPAEGMAIL
jgi:Fe-S-cluster-containing dehydrogenase component